MTATAEETARQLSDEIRDRCIRWKDTDYIGDLAEELITAALLAHGAAERARAIEEYAAWRPIETATKDGTEVLIVYDRYEGEYSGSEPEQWEMARGVAMARFVAKHGCEYWEGDYKEYSDECWHYRATHWMPVPPLPEPVP